jgi:hypothetical protein
MEEDSQPQLIIYEMRRGLVKRKHLHRMVIYNNKDSSSSQVSGFRARAMSQGKKVSRILFLET